MKAIQLLFFVGSFWQFRSFAYSYLSILQGEHLNLLGGKGSWNFDKNCILILWINLENPSTCNGLNDGPKRIYYNLNSGTCECEFFWKLTFYRCNCFKIRSSLIYSEP